eukprot:4831674-Amphidinium_carterae.1
MVPEDAEEQEEARPAKAGSVPYTPSAREVDEHECAGHATFRTWCQVCVQSRGTGPQHRAWKHGEEELPLVALDFGFLNGSHDADRPI